MLVTVPVVGVTLVTAVPVTGLTVALVTAVPVTGLRVALVTAAPVTGVRVALVKNGTGAGLAVTPVKAAAIVGVMPVTTLVPGVPMTPLIALAKVAVAPVIHVAAEAEDNRAALRPPTVRAASIGWCEPEAKSANSQVVAWRGTADRLIRALQKF
jgi:hypothetical protein